MLASVVVTTSGQKLMLAVFSIIRKYFNLGRARGANGNCSRMSFARRLIRLGFQGSKSVDNTELERCQIAAAMHWLGIVLQKKGDLDGAEAQYHASLSH